MDRLVYVAMTGAKQLMQAQTLVSHNLANANTHGFRADLARFQASAIDGPGYPSRVNSVASGAGFDHSQGTLINTGRTLDLGLHGMRVTTELKIPVDSKLKLLVAKVPTSGNSYSLFGELRWNTDLAAGFLFGIKLEETEEFEIWREAFGAEFVAPVLGRSKD